MKLSDRTLACPVCNHFLMHTGGTIPPLLYPEIFECSYCDLEITIKKREEKKMDDKLVIEMSCPQCDRMDEFVFIGEGSIGNKYECPGCGSVIEIAITVNEPERKFHETFNRVTDELAKEWAAHKDVYTVGEPFGLGALVGYLIKKGVLE